MSNNRDPNRWNGLTNKLDFVVEQMIHVFDKLADDRLNNRNSAAQKSEGYKKFFVQLMTKKNSSVLG